jgi:hypothetical protein
VTPANSHCSSGEFVFFNFPDDVESASIAVSSNVSKGIGDTGASCHMMQDELTFVALKKLDRPVTIQVAEAGRTLVASHGGLARVELKNQDGTWSVVDLEDAILVPGLDTNLISLGRLTKVFYEIRIANNIMSLWRKNNSNGDKILVVTIPAKNHVFPMSIRPASSIILARPKRTCRPLTLGSPSNSERTTPPPTWHRATPRPPTS